MNINKLTIGQAKELSGMFSEATVSNGINSQLGEDVIVRTYSAGVWFGILAQKSGSEVILEGARRLYYWKAKKSISLSGVAVYGIDKSSKVCPAISKQWLDAIEIISLTEDAIKSIEEHPDAEAN